MHAAYFTTTTPQHNIFVSTTQNFFSEFLCVCVRVPLPTQKENYATQLIIHSKLIFKPLLFTSQDKQQQLPPLQKRKTTSPSNQKNQVACPARAAGKASVVFASFT